MALCSSSYDADSTPGVYSIMLDPAQPAPPDERLAPEIS
jgi:hypothetical protein